MQKAFDEHLARAVEPIAEAVELDRQCGAQRLLARTDQLPAQRAIAGIVDLPQPDQMRNRIAEGADADLQRAAIGVTCVAIA